MNYGIRIFAGLVLIGLTAVALAMTVLYYQSAGTDQVTQWIYTALAVLSACLKPLMVAMLPYLARHKAMSATCIVVFIAAMSFDAIGVKGFLEMTRGANIAAESATSNAWTLAKEKRDRLQLAADEMKSAKTAAAIEPELTRMKALAGDCRKARAAATEECAKIATLETELANAKEAERRAAALQLAQIEFDKLPVPVSAPERSEVKVLGISLTLILSVLIFILFEGGVVASSFAAFNGGDPPKPKPPAPTPKAPKNDGGTRAPRPANKKSATPETVLSFLRDVASGAAKAPGVAAHQGKVVAGQRALGEACGTTAATVNRLLKVLSDRGDVRIAVGSGGTEIELT